MSLHLSLCREIRPSFQSGHPGIHSTWGSKLRVPLTYLLLREGSSWGACGKLAYHFIGRQESFSSWDDMGCTELSSSGYTEIDEIDEIERGISINHWSFLKGVQPLVLMMWIVGCLRVKFCGNWPHLNLILVTTSYFAFPRWHQCSSRLVTVFVGTLWSSVKQIEAAYMFVWENKIALHAMQGNRASSRGKREISWVFSSCGRNLGYIHEYGGDVHSKLEFVQQSQDTCLGTTDTSEI